MNYTNTFIAGALLGAGIMYLLDPDRGPRRRALVRDKLEHGGRKLAERAEGKAEHVRNKAKGLAHDAREVLRDDEDQLDDATLEARVRAALGREVSNPGAIHVTAYGGRITITGKALASEVDSVVRTILAVRGVGRVDNFLEVHESAEGVSALQGAASRAPEQPNSGVARQE